MIDVEKHAAHWREGAAEDWDVAGYLISRGRVRHGLKAGVDMLDEAVTGTVRRYLHDVTESGIPVRFGVVFGSQAEGRAGPWSDIDLLVVSPTFDDLRDRRPIDLLWRLSARVDSRIEFFADG